jgi:two-component system, NtrC family, sensor kinase
MASLFVVRGRDQGRRFELKEDLYVLGRDRESSLQIHDSEVSRQHAEIRRIAGGYEVVDLGSSNGTFVNTLKVDTRPLRSGDRVQLGGTLLIYTAPSEGDVTEAAPINILEAQVAEDASQIVASMSPVMDSGMDENDEGELGEEGDEAWVQRARSHLQLMYRTAMEVSHTQDIDELLGRLLDLIFEWVAADRGCVMLMDHESQLLVPKARRDRAEEAESETLSISRTILDYVLDKNEGVVTSNAGADQRWEAGRSILAKGVREAICVPMQGRYGRVGAIYIDTYTPPGDLVIRRASRKLTDEHLKFMVAIGHQAALAVEDTFYYSSLVQAERMAAMGQAIAGLSHDIKNILQGMQGGSFLVDVGLKNGDRGAIDKGWSIVLKNQERISNLVMDMLTFSKDRRPEPEECNLNELVTDVCELILSRADDTNSKLTIQLSPDLPLLYFDSDMMHRAILNVAANAVDACRDIEVGEVTIATRLSDDHETAIVTISDNGTGIPPGELDRIFQVFESSKGSRGTGLGLPVSLKILREHDGTIEVSSTPGSGSTFSLQFPSQFGHM